jgi:hypothetical protein
MTQGDESMRLFSFRRYSWLLPLLFAAPLAAQWTAPVIALHLKTGKAEDQLGMGEGPDSDYYGSVDEAGDIAINDVEKNRVLLYAPGGERIHALMIPPEARDAWREDPRTPLIYPSAKRIMSRTGEHRFCMFSFDGSISRCSAGPVPMDWEELVFERPEKKFLLRLHRLTHASVPIQDACLAVSLDGALSEKQVTCPPEAEQWSETTGHKQLSLSGVTFNATEMTKPDGWHYVLVNRAVAIGHCDSSRQCAAAAFDTAGKQLAAVKLPYQENVFDVDPNGNLYSIRLFRKNEVIIYKRAWTGPAAPKVPAKTATSPRPMYYDREMVFEDLDGRTMRELDLLRNTIYARAGNPFRKKWLHDYFTALPWYKPLEKMDEKQLTELDKKNARMIMEYSLDLGEADLRDTAEKLQQRAFKESLSAEEKIEVRLLSIRLGKWFGAEKDKAEYQPNPLENPARLDQAVTLEDLSDFSRRDLRLLRNTVYARRGKPFTSETLGTYFGDMEWYHSDPSYNEKKLSKTDLQNVAVILSLERTLGGPMSEKEAQGEQSLEGA